MLDVRALATIAGVVLFATSAQADDSEFDLRGALAVGTGWSGPFKSSALIGGFHDQLRVKSLRPWLGLELSTGLSFVAAPPVAGSPANTPLRGFTSSSRSLREPQTLPAGDKSTARRVRPMAS